MKSLASKSDQAHQRRANANRNCVGQTAQGRKPESQNTPAVELESNGFAAIAQRNLQVRADTGPQVVARRRWLQMADNNPIVREKTIQR